MFNFVIQQAIYIHNNYIGEIYYICDIITKSCNILAYVSGN